MNGQGAHGRHGSGARSNLSGGQQSVARRAEPGQERDVGYPRDRPDYPPEPTDRHAQEGPHDSRVELVARATGQLLPRRHGAEWLLIGADSRHHLERVRYRDDASTERNVVPREPERVAGPVEALVVLFDGQAPFA